MATRKILGPVVKNRAEDFVFSVFFGDVIPVGEVLDAPASSVRSIRRSDGTNTSADLLGALVPLLVGTEGLSFHLQVNIAADDGDHIVELEAVTDGPSTFEAEILVHIEQRRVPVLYVIKRAGENFPVGVDFAGLLLAGETITAGAATSVNRFGLADTSTILLSVTPQIDITAGEVVVEVIQDVAPPAQTGSHWLLVQATTSLGNIYQDTVQVDVEGSQ